MSTECSADKTCKNQKCVSPCPGPCGQNTDCKVINHSPICTCKLKYTGDPFSNCYKMTGKLFYLNILLVQFDIFTNMFTFLAPISAVPETDPCLPSPCGFNAQCQNLRGVPSCSCLPGFEGSPPNCRPECTINEDCASNLACIKQKCNDPCKGSCGINANCHVMKHVAVCTCNEGFTGNAFTQCTVVKQKGIYEQNKKTKTNTVR